MGSKFYIENKDTGEVKDEHYLDFNEAINSFVDMFSLQDVKLNIDFTVKPKNTLGKTIYYDLGLDNWKIVQKIGE